ncbi:hypothetical protein [Streptosporangium saharense]|uniref:hypothetical protein n=1 Tax=Streptosporangium saharense TaxID=1706840 RepID=UPI00343ACD95
MQTVEDFEDASLAVSISGTWARSSAEAGSGGWSYRSGTVPDTGGASDAVVQVPAWAKSLTFLYRVSSESGYDFLKILVGSTEVLSQTGEVSWNASGKLDVTGASTVTFRYTKDSSQHAGLDAAFIDDVTFSDAAVTEMTNNFDGGTHGATIVEGESGGVSGDAFHNVVGTPRYSNARFHGTSGLSVVNPAPGTDTHIDWGEVSQPGDVFCSRLYIHRVGELSGYAGLFALLGPSGIVSKAWLWTNGEIDVYTGSSTTKVLTIGRALPIGQWSRVEFRYTINSLGSGTAEAWTYLDPDSTIHDDYVISSTVTWPGGKPDTTEFHLGGAGSGYWHLDDLGIGPAKLGPVSSAAQLRPGVPAATPAAVHRTATW